MILVPAAVVKSIKSAAVKSNFREFKAFRQGSLFAWVCNVSGKAKPEGTPAEVTAKRTIHKEIKIEYSIIFITQGGSNAFV